MNHRVKILSTASLSHDVIQFRLERPTGYSFNAGQAIELLIDGVNASGPAPFTFTGLNANPYLELIIKIYKKRNGLTSALASKKAGDSVLIGAPWDSFINKGPGVFIAGGAGITPFIALLRQLKVDKNIEGSYLFFSNKTRKDIFLENELQTLLGDRYYNIITREPIDSRDNRLDDKFLKKHITDLEQPFYLCGPPGFTESLEHAITKLGAKQDVVNVSF